MKRLAISTALLVLTGLTGACKQADEAKQEEKPVTAAPTVVESRGALASRREAQDHLDKAREHFLARDMNSAAIELRSASTFMRDEADSSLGEVKERMLASARELDVLAGDLEKKSVTSEKTLDNAFARVQRAEAERHHANAVEAWAKRENARVSDELTMAADHFERAAKDAGEVVGTGARKALNDSREIAGQLTKGAGFVPEQVGKVLESLGMEIRALGSKIEKRKA